MGKKSREKRERRELREQGITQENKRGRVGQFGWDRILLEIIRWGVYATLLIPLIVSGKSFFPFITPKALYFMGLVEVIFSLWLVLLLFFPKYRPKLNLPTIALSLFLFILVLATIFGVDPSRSFWSNYERQAGLLMYFHLFAFFLVLISVFRKKEDWIKILMASVVVASVVGIIELIAELIGESRMPISVARHGATLGNSSFLATYLLFNLFFGLYVLAKGKRWLQLTIIPLLIIIFTALFTSTGRAALLASLVGLALVLLIYLSFRVRHQTLKQLTRVSLVITVLGILLGTILLCIPGTFVQHELDKYSTKSRAANWQIAMKAIKERPILGWGPEGYELAFDKHFNPHFFLRQYGGEIWFDRAHNIVFDTAIDGGILGLLSYFFLFFAAIYSLWKRYFEDKQRFWQAAIFSSLLIAYFIQGLTVFDAPASLVMMFLTFAFVTNPMTFSEKAPHSKMNNATRGFIAIIVFIVLIFSLQKFVFQPAQASLNLIKSLIAQNSQERLSFEKKALAATSLGKYQLRVYMGDNLLKKAWKKKASLQEINYITKQLEKTMKESPGDLRSALTLGKLYVVYAEQFNGKKLADAQRIAKRAIKISPTNQQGYWLLSQVEFLGGNCPASLSLAKRALSLAPQVKQSKSFLQKVENACSKKKNRNK